MMPPVVEKKFLLFSMFFLLDNGIDFTRFRQAARSK
jgi:hypothetical protein